MTENKDKQPAAEEKAKERNWISASLWADKEDIRKGAERYGEVNGTNRPASGRRCWC